MADLDNTALPLVFVRHDSVEPASPLRPGLPGNELHDVVTGEPDHDAWLRERGIGSIVGYEVLFAIDATHTFDRAGPDGEIVTADELARATAASLHEEFATVVRTDTLVNMS